MSITSSDNEAEATADQLIQGRQQRQRSQGSAATTSAADLTEIGNFAGCLRYLAVGVRHPDPILRHSAETYEYSILNSSFATRKTPTAK